MQGTSPARRVRHRPVHGIVVAIVGGQEEPLTVTLMMEATRALHQGCVYELVYTGADARPGNRVTGGSTLGFFEVRQASVAVVGDDVRVRGSVLGEIAGFDGSHLPDHLHVVVGGKLSGDSLAWGFSLGDKVVIGPAL